MPKPVVDSYEVKGTVGERRLNLESVPDDGSPEPPIVAEETSNVAIATLDDCTTALAEGEVGCSIVEFRFSGELMVDE